MNYYELSPADPTGDVILIFKVLLGPPYLEIKPRYARYQCSNFKCKKLDHEGIFEYGFDDGLKIREKRDLLVTTEGFTCFSEKALGVVERHSFKGLRWKPLTGTKWFVVNSVCHVKADETAY